MNKPYSAGKNIGNKGVIITGGSINATNMITGDNASIQSNTSMGANASANLHEELLRLIELMKQHDVAKDKIDAAEVAKSELEKDEPNSVIVNSILGSVVESIKGIGAISGSVATITALLMG